ncbi:MAG: hypothetical protein EAZ57_10245 [Cytophagales bacterium]|nr:MAG: hypothetical protein EAZ67_06035 [Cytophagales bacterium]TAF59713.1 MAG: hypothetical protein EAZ57_10245 [Cytophagales bacterium]
MLFCITALRRYHLFLVLCLSALWGCTPELVNTSSNVFDSSVFIQAQSKVLQAKKAKLQKIANGSEKQELTLPNWERELFLFAEANINKNLIRDQYTCSDTPQETLYTAKDSRFKVKSLRILKNAQGQPKQIDIHYKETSKLYNIERAMSLELRQNVLKRYRIEGVQKVFGLSPIQYRLDAEVVF